MKFDDPSASDTIIRNWSMWGCPVRPGQEDILLFQKKLKSIEESRVLILGCTPELVDMVLEENPLRVTIMDRFPPNVTAMKKMATKNWSRVEVIIRDWRTPLDDLTDRYNIVLGDGPFTFLRFPDDYLLICRNLNRYISDGGLVVIRNMVWMERSPDELDSYYRQIMNRLREWKLEKNDPVDDIFVKNTVSELWFYAFFKANTDPAKLCDEQLRYWTGKVSCDLFEIFGERIFKVTEVVLDTRGLNQSYREQRIPVQSIPRIEEMISLFESCHFLLMENTTVGCQTVPGIWRIVTFRNMKGFHRQEHRGKSIPHAAVPDRSETGEMP